ncbi:hypothetical protein CBP19_00005, partial [Fischerella thermalis WC1110]
LAKTCRGLLTVPQRIFLWKNNCKKRRGMDARLPRSNSLNHREFSPVRVNTPMSFVSLNFES